MPFPLVRLITIIVDCIHNATTGKNQDEFCFFGGKFDLFVEKFCRKNLRSIRDGKYAPGQAGPPEPRGADRPTRSLRNDTPRSRSNRRGKFPGTEAAVEKDRCFILAKIAT